MDAFDAVIGLDEQSLNGFIGAVYGVAREEVFHRVVKVGDLGFEPLEAVEIDVATVPRISLSTAGSRAGGPASAAGLELAVDRLTLTLHYAGDLAPTTLECSVRAPVTVAADERGVLLPQLGAVVVDIPHEAKLSEVVNKLLVPSVDRLVRERVLGAIRVPPVRYEGITMTSPVLSSGSGRLLATSSVAPATTAAAPVTWRWPDGRVFVAVDFELLNRLAETVVPTIEPVSGRWSTTFKIGLLRSTLKVDYSGTLTRLELAPVPGHPERITGTAEIATSLQAHAKNLGSASGKGITRVGVEGAAVFTSGTTLAIQLVGLGEFVPDIDINNCPPWLERQYGKAATAIGVALRGAISSKLAARPPIEIGRLPSFPMDLPGTELVIAVSRPVIATIAAPDGRSLLAATGLPEVHRAA